MFFAHLKDGHAIARKTDDVKGLRSLPYTAEDWPLEFWRKGVIC